MSRLMTPRMNEPIPPPENPPINSGTPIGLVADGSFISACSHGRKHCFLQPTLIPIPSALAAGLRGPILPSKVQELSPPFP
jgi:hypothetical protein